MIRITLHPHWKSIAKKAWSFRLLALAGLLSTCEMILPMFSEAMPRHIFALLSFIAITGAMFARLVAQKDMLQ
jgi:hypothetical protein